MSGTTYRVVERIAGVVNPLVHARDLPTRERAEAWKRSRAIAMWSRLSVEREPAREPAA